LIWASASQSDPDVKVETSPWFRLFQSRLWAVSSVWQAFSLEIVLMRIYIQAIIEVDMPRFKDLGFHRHNAQISDFSIHISALVKQNIRGTKIFDCQ
jgi:hypothetical protein